MSLNRDETILLGSQLVEVFHPIKKASEFI